jgi:hypothetical protein
MKMMQASMIYAQENVARMIAGKLTKSKGVEYLVEKVTTGFRVSPKATPKTAPKIIKEAEITSPKLVKTWAQGDAVIISLKFRGESASYVDAWNNGKPISFGKSTLIAWELDGDYVLLKMPVSIAKKRGLWA